MTECRAIVAQNPVVFTRDGEVFANSLDIANYFGKRHRVITSAVERLLAEDPGCVAHYRQTSIPVLMPLGGSKEVAGYEMTQTGFTLVGMGLTGRKAIAFKLRYIAAFDAMKETLKRQAQPLDLSDPASLRNLLLGYTEKVIALETTVAQQDKVIAEATPKAEFYDAYADSSGLTQLMDIGRVLGVGPKKMLDWLEKQRVLFRTSRKGPLRAKNQYLKKGWFEYRTVLKNDAERVQTMVTPRGIQGVAEMLGRSTDLFGRISKSDPLPLTRH